MFSLQKYPTRSGHSKELVGSQRLQNQRTQASQSRRFHTSLSFKSVQFAQTVAWQVAQEGAHSMRAAVLSPHLTHVHGHSQLAQTALKHSGHWMANRSDVSRRFWARKGSRHPTQGVPKRVMYCVLARWNGGCKHHCLCVGQSADLQVSEQYVATSKLKQLSRAVPT
jgi:hypothetical protein